MSITVPCLAQNILLQTLMGSRSCRWCTAAPTTALAAAAPSSAFIRQAAAAVAGE